MLRDGAAILQFDAIKRIVIAKPAVAVVINETRLMTEMKGVVQIRWSILPTVEGLFRGCPDLEYC